MEQENKTLSKSKKRIALIIVSCILIAIVFIVMPVLTVIIYNDNLVRGLKPPNGWRIL